MDFVVQFIGIVLFVTLSGGGLTSYHVVMPNEAEICGMTTTDLGDHETFIRVPKDSEAQSGWSGNDIIPTADSGTMYRVTDASISFDNLANKGPVRGTLTAPHLYDYHPMPDKAVLKSALYQKSLTNAELDIRTGVVANDELPNGMIDTLWLLQSVPSKNIVIRVTTRGTAEVKTLTVKPGTRIQIINAPKKDAEGDIGGASANDHHFVIYYNLTLPKPDPDECTEPQPGGGGTLQRAFDMKMTMRKDEHSRDGDGGASIACSNSQWP